MPSADSIPISSRLQGILQPLVGWAKPAPVSMHGVAWRGGDMPPYMPHAITSYESGSPRGGGVVSTTRLSDTPWISHSCWYFHAR
jgi:hypothetical protein